MKTSRSSLIASLASALALAAAASPASAQSLERRPYLQLVTPTSATVVWTTDVASNTRLRYGPSPQSLTNMITLDPAVTQHEVKLTGLTPGSRYYYSVGTTSAVLAGGDDAHYFETAPTTGTPKKFRAWVVGDSGYNAQVVWDVRDSAVNYFGAYRPHLLLHMGDMAYNSGTPSEFTTNFFGNFHTVLRNTVTWPAFGNHEGLSAESSSQSGPYYTAFVLPKAGEAGGLASGTEAYYSFDYANVHFVVLNSYDVDRSQGGAMLTWLAADLAATNQEWIIAYWHHPAYSKGNNDSDTDLSSIEMRENALPILEAAGVDLVLAGHSHIYERSFLIDGAYATPTVSAGHILDSGDGKPLGNGPYVKSAGLNDHDGAVYVVAGHAGYAAGTGGHPVMYFTEARSGSCVLDVQGNRLGLVNVRSDNQITDRFAMIKGTGLLLAAPDGGEKINQGEAYSVRWRTVGSIPSVKLEYSTDDGAAWTTITSSTPNTGQYAWTPPAINTSRALVRVSSAQSPSIADESNMGFTLQPPVQTAIQLGDYWTYDDRGIDHGTAWRSAGFDDTTWKAGYAELGYGDGDEDTLLYQATPVYPSAYFRKIVPVNGAVTQAAMKLIHDDGVVVWVNGVQVYSKYIGSTAYSAYATSGGPDNELTTVNLSLTNNPFVVGSNVIAVMVKQVSSSSNDLTFDMELTLTVGSGSGSTGGDGGSSSSSSSSSSSVSSSASSSVSSSASSSSSSSSVSSSSVSSSSVSSSSSSSAATSSSSSSGGGTGGTGGAGGAGGDPCMEQAPTCVVIRRGAFGTVADATLWQSNPTYKDGASASVYTGVSSGSQRYSLLRYDLGFVPTSSAVCSAILKVTQAWKSTNTTVRLHQVLVPWTETNVTWNNLLGGWDPFALGSFVAASGSGDRAVDVTGQVQDWVDGVANYGFLLEEDASADRSQLYASEYASPVERRPRLELCYVP